MPDQVLAGQQMNEVDSIRVLVSCYAALANHNTNDSVKYVSRLKPRKMLRLITPALRPGLRNSMMKDFSPDCMID